MTKKLLLSGLLKECETGKTAELRTEFSCFEDEEYLYFNFHCEQDFPCPKHTEYNKPLYEGDIVEVLLTLNYKNRYLEIEVNQNNAKYCVIIDNIDGEGDIIITKIDICPFIAENKIINEEWKCSITIPKEELIKIGWTENSLINAHRQDFDKRGKLNLYSLYPTFSRSFHKTIAFKKLIKVGEKQ